MSDVNQVSFLESEPTKVFLHGCHTLVSVYIRAGTNTPSDEYDTYRDIGWRIRYVSRIHFFSEAKLGNG